MTRRHDTDALIAALADQVGRAGSPSRSFEEALPIAAAVGLAVAGALALMFFGAGEDIARTLAGAWLYRKLTCMALLSAGAWLVLTDVARPGTDRVRFWALAPGLVVMSALAVVDTSGLGLGGRGVRSIPTCVGAIALLSMPSLALILTVVRAYAAATSARMAGAAAGLLSGALGGAAYAFACRNNGGLFVATWYGLALGSTTVVGSIVGRRFLAW